MHHRLIVLTNALKEKGEMQKFKTSLDVRIFVRTTLEKEGFTFQGRFAAVPSDWFKIGGRWSEELSLQRLNPLLWSSFEEKVEERLGQTINKKTKWVALDIFKEFFPNYKGMIPYFRNNSYQDLGEDDDAQIVDEILWKRFIRDLVKKSGDDHYEDPLIYLDGAVTDLSKKYVVGQCWAIVVDYHN